LQRQQYILKIYWDKQATEIGQTAQQSLKSKAVLLRTVGAIVGVIEKSKEVAENAVRRRLNRQ